MCGLSVVEVSWDYSQVAVHGLLIVVASLVAEHILEHAAPVIVACRLSCPEACRIFPDRSHVPCTGRGMLSHWTTREVPDLGCLTMCFHKHHHAD